MLNTVKKKITLSQVAQEAGVSKSLVSSLVSGKTYGQGQRAGIGLSPATRERIVQTIRHLRYTPPDPRMNLTIYPELGHYAFLVNRESMSGFADYYSEIFKGVFEQMSKGQSTHNLNLTQFDGEADYIADPSLLPYAVREGMTNKYILVGHPNYSLIMALLERGYHAIYLSRLLNIKGVASAAPDYVQAGYLAVQHLLQKGHRNISIAGEYYFRGMDFHVQSFVKGIQQAFAEVGKTFSDDEIVISSEPDQLKPSTFISELAKQGQKPTAVFCMCDWTASRLMREMMQSGLLIPRDLSVIGCNDQSISRNFMPTMTTIHFPLHELGEHAIQWFSQLKPGEPLVPTQTLLPVKLVERESVRNI